MARPQAGEIRLATLLGMWRRLPHAMHPSHFSFAGPKLELDGEEGHHIGDQPWGR